MDPIIIIQLGAALAPLVTKLLSKRIKAQKQDSVKVSEAIERHLTEVSNWASTFQFFGMGSPQSVEQSTIALDLYTQPRRFQSATEPTTTKCETNLLSDPSHCLMLGEPGSGKTTTFKRIALAMLRQSPADELNILWYPMVIRLREMLEGESLYDKIAGLFGLVIVPHERIILVKTRDPRGRIIEEERKHIEMRIGDEKVEDVIPVFLDESRTLLLLDGLDELRIEYREQIRNEIVKLGRRLNKSKIIVSCRTGDYTKNMEGFIVNEICPLSEDQILAIKDRWLGPDDTGFMERFRNLPYYDVADRPLLLTQLLFLYKRYGYLPDQPSQIYAKIIRLLLEEWDAESSVRRVSEYSGFNPTQKSDFLASLAYQLTYALNITRFTPNDLVSAYLPICDRFNLPTNEAPQVAQEIQTHTGIIVMGPEDIYEFCHLSLQEYLCAVYIVRAPIETQSIEYLAKYATPLAIAVALSSHPSNWFAYLILHFDNLNSFDEASMTSFLSRIIVERPNFQKSEPLGFAILRLFKHYQKNSKVCQYLEHIIKIQSVLESVASALRSYTLRKRESISADFVEVSLRPNLVHIYRFNLPLEGAFPKEYISEIRKIDGDSLLLKK